MYKVWFLADPSLFLFRTGPGPLMPLVFFSSPYPTHMPGVHVCRVCVCRVWITRCAADWRRKLLLRPELLDCVIAPKGKCVWRCPLCVVCVCV